MLFLAYFGVFSLIPFFAAGDRSVLRWHAKQGVAVFLTYAAVSILELVLLLAFPFAGALVTGLFRLVKLGLLSVDIFAMVKAFRGERWRIPVVADLAGL